MNAIRNPRYEQLRDFHSTHGHCNITCTAANASFFSWMSDIRKKHRRSKLSAEKVELLKAVDFPFERTQFDLATKMKLADEQWEENFGPMVVFYEEHGHCDVEDENPKLARWLSAMQGNKALNSSRQHLIRKLLQKAKARCSVGQCTKYALFGGHCRDHMPNKGALGPALGPAREDNWEKQYKCLVEFRKSHGHCRVLTEHNQDR